MQILLWVCIGDDLLEQGDARREDSVAHHHQAAVEPAFVLADQLLAVVPLGMLSMEEWALLGAC
jgi:hypothetical protein